MKKQSILFLAAGAALLASCGNDAGTTGMSQAQVDSIVNVKVQELTMHMQASNDSMINYLAQVKADSMIAAMNAGKPATAKTVKPKAPVMNVRDHASAGQNATLPPKNPATDRPGAKDNTPKTATDRPGATDNTPKTATDRPGAQKK